MGDRKRHVDIELVPSTGGNCCTPFTLAPADAEQVARQVKLLSALADPTRLQIVSMLAGVDEPLCVCDITTRFDLGQPTISHHLKVLRDAQLVDWEKRGLWVYYSLREDVLAQAHNYLDGLLSSSRLAAV